MNTQTNSIKPSLNIETFIEMAKNWKWNFQDFTPIAQKFMYDLDKLKMTNLPWIDREYADKCIKDLKVFYMLDENATIDELKNEIVTRYNNYKIENPNYYRQTEFSKAFEKVLQNI